MTLYLNVKWIPFARSECDTAKDVPQSVMVSVTLSVTTLYAIKVLIYQYFTKYVNYLPGRCASMSVIFKSLIKC